MFTEAYCDGKILSIVLDGADGYASSFLDEAFGNLVYDFGITIVLDSVEIISNEEPEWIDMIVNDTCHQWQKRRTENKSPRVTALHKAWSRLVDNKLEKNVWEIAR